jgi:HK97 gp10 family phage protein
MEGKEALRAKLRALPDAIKAQIAAALEAGAQEIVRLAQSLVPIDQGDLRKSIGYTFGAAPKGSVVLAQSSGEQSDLRITIYAGDSDAFYARWIDFGTQKMRARPFFFPAYRANKRRVRSRITRAVNKAARTVAKGGG